MLRAARRELRTEFARDRARVYGEKCAVWLERWQNEIPANNRRSFINRSRAVARANTVSAYSAENFISFPRFSVGDDIARAVSSKSRTRLIDFIEHASFFLSVT